MAADQTWEPKLADVGLAGYLEIVRRRRWSIAVVLVGVMTAVVVFTLFLQERTYRSTAEVLVRTEETSSLFPLDGAVDSTRSIDGERAFLASLAFTEHATSQSPTDSDVEVITDDTGRGDASSIMVFEATASTAEEAAAAANAWAAAYITLRFELEMVELTDSIVAMQGSIDDLADRRAIHLQPLIDADSAISRSTDPLEIARLGAERLLLVDKLAPELDALDAQLLNLNTNLETMRVRQDLVRSPDFLARVDLPAEAPDGPFSPSITRNLGLGVVSALMLSAGFVLVLESLDARVRSVDDVRAVTGLRYLASVPKLKRRGTTPGLDQAYQRVVSAFGLAEAERGATQVVLVASAQPDEGKSSTAIALARLVATGGSRTLLIDADLHRPTAGQRLKVANRIGLSDFLAGDRSVDDVVFQAPSIPRLDIIPSGRPEAHHAIDLLRTPQFGVLIEKLRDTYDRIVIDSPPLLTVVDPVEIALHVDCSVLVIRSGRTRADELAEAVRILESSGAPILGTVLVAPPGEITSAYEYLY